MSYFLSLLAYILYKSFNGSQLAKMKKYIPCHCHEIDREEAVGLKSSNFTLKSMIFVNMWNLGQFR